MEHETTENPCVASSILAWTTILSAEQALSRAFFVAQLLNTGNSLKTHGHTLFFSCPHDVYTFEWFNATL
jgi:hypothetical protein